MAKSVKLIQKNRRKDHVRQQADLLIDMLLDEGHKPAYITTILTEKYQITPSQAFKDVRRVREARATSLANGSNDLLLSDYKEKADLVYRHALKKGDFGTALRSLETGLKILKEHKGGSRHGQGKSVESQGYCPTERLEDTLRALANDGKTD